MKEFILSCFVLIGVTSSFASVPKKHKSCKTVTDCQIVGTGSCCADDLALNKAFSATYSKPTHEYCHSIKIMCPQVVAVCENSFCKKSEKAK